MASPISMEGRAASGTKAAPPCTLVIFGAGGDLTKRLLMPALYNLAGSRLLAGELSVWGIDHVDGSDESWRQNLTATMDSFTKDAGAEFHAERIDPEAWGFVRERLHYLKGDFLAPETYRDIAARVPGSAVFYLAVAARFFAPIVEHLGAAGLLKQEGGAFRRVVIEKPFGSDLASARELNRRLLAVAEEPQLYRIDHFLGKETVQSIMAIRFANGMFEPIWRREHVDHVQITAAETIGVEERGAFYEPTGALRDMVPNHLFQLLCMTAMEPPNSFDAEAVRTEKAKLVQAVRPVPLADAVRGQYAAGRLLGRDVAAYRAEPHVAADSRTETYAALKLTIDNWRWAGVPFYLRTGKRMTGRRTEIAVHFKPAPYQLFRDTPVDQLAPNILRIQVDPDQGTVTQFNAKVPGPTMRLAKVSTSYREKDFFDEKPNVGYETLLYDCMIGDATLFQRADNIEASWAVVEPLVAGWGQGGAPQAYAAGSAGPADADALLARDGRHWLPLDGA
ncbi:Glucose-6-phosphate 1-dehydrogenase [Methylobacterium crusticola]|uniref:Glucose-6-phosphate 1-dehydrogenase n=1 Tax=Methylobacterium crusticola TaxID=1697972 RepID=A0ABQ4R5B5_9HYPH|nr:glucose-6-phosphate dehydrogenase [Methylobacterium crusticola]GJD52873.1 Glucose-6-phosphate 1-dehydrogenase [Methylobacterium crusticola]